MRKECLSGLCLLVMILLFTGCVKDEPVDEWSLAAGDALPEFSIVSLEGWVIDQNSFAGKRGVVVFFSTTCGDCIREMPLLEAEYKKCAGSEEVEIICISRDDDVEAVREFVEEYNITMPTAVDDGRRVYSKFAKSGVPRVFVVENGIIVESYLEKIPSTIF